MLSNIILLIAVAVLIPVVSAGQRFEIPEGYEHAHVFGQHMSADTYVEKPDPNYAWVESSAKTYAGSCFGMPNETWTGYLVNMTSQQWLTAEETSQPIWWHWMVIVVPDAGVNWDNTGAMYITGGHNGGAPSPTGEDVEVVSYIACHTQTITSALFQIPNEPIQFWDEDPPKKRTEDALLAWAWNHYLDYPTEPEWLPRLPMTKAAVRAMDTMNDWSFKKFGTNLTQFLIAGASKRGWTTWTTAAVDDRIIGQVPIVYDYLNFVPNIKHQFRAYCGWSFALVDYWDLNFTAKIDDPTTQDMMDIIDPYVYLSRYAPFPTHMISTSGDEFMMPDATRWWDDAIPKEVEIKWSMMPNCEHSIILCVQPVLDRVAAFLFSIMEPSAPPRYDISWNIDPNNGTITLYPSHPPQSVTAWYSHSPANSGRRDFRLVDGTGPNRFRKGEDVCIWVQVVLWYSRNVKSKDGGKTYVYHHNPPAKGGWTGFFLEVAYPGYEDHTYTYTTDVSIQPQTYPCAECHFETCRGELL